MLAHTELAIARLRSGALDAATAALEPVMALRPGERTAVQVKRLADLRKELAGAIFHGSAHARELAEQIEEFTRQAVVELHRRGVRAAAAVAGVADGAAWVQGFFDYHRPDAVRILDFAHAADPP